MPGASGYYLFTNYLRAYVFSILYTFLLYTGTLHFFICPCVFEARVELPLAAAENSSV